RRGRVAAGTRRLEPGQVLLPQRLLVLAQPVQVVPSVDAGVVAVAELRLDCVVADRLDRVDADVGLSGLQRLLAGAVAAHLGRRRMNAQELERQPEQLAVGDLDLEDARALMDDDARRRRASGIGTSHGWIAA